MTMVSGERGTSPGWVEDVLDFWFGDLDESGLAPAERSARWWTKDTALDQEIEKRFGHLLAAAGRGELEHGSSPRERLAALIVLDQFSRNVGRATGEMFAHDAAALALAREMVEQGDDQELPASMRSFCYLPFMHSEELADQERCIELFEEMAEQSEGRVREAALNNLDFARRHHVIVERFGRFPHRNDLLGRKSSAEELAFLQEDGSSF